LKTLLSRQGGTGNILPCGSASHGRKDFESNFIFARIPVDCYGECARYYGSKDHDRRKIMIEHFSFGKIIVNGISFTNDIKIVQGRVVPEWWRKRGHLVDVEDIKDIIQLNPDILVIGKGEPGQMRSSGALQEIFRNNGIVLIEEKTSKAVETFNRLWKEGKNVSAGLHLSC